MTPDANYQAEAQNKFEILLEKNYPGFRLIGESTITNLYSVDTIDIVSVP